MQAMIVSDAVLKYLARGFVLSRKGKWVPLSRAVGEDEKLGAHIFKGQVVQSGRWVELNTLFGEEETVSEVEKPAKAKDDYLVDQDTKVFSLKSLEEALGQEGESASEDDFDNIGFSGDDVLAMEDSDELEDEQKAKPETELLEVEVVDGERDEDGEPVIDDEPVGVDKTKAPVAAGGKLNMWWAQAGRHRYIIVAATIGAIFLACGILLILAFTL
jgi:hypothetical protein